MKPPRIPLAALVLVLAAAAAAAADEENPFNLGKTADGKTIVAPDAVGPSPTPTCLAGSPDCTPTGDPATTNSLMDIGKQQQEESGAQMLPPEKVDKLVDGENKALEDGTFKDVHRTPYGSVITFPDGRVSWSSYKTGQTTLPIDPAKCASNPQCPPELKSYAEEQARKDKDQKEFQAKNDAMYTGNKTMYGQDGNNKDKGTKTTPEPKESSSVDVDKQGRQQGEDLSGLIAGNQNGGRNPETEGGGDMAPSATNGSTPQSDETVSAVDTADLEASGDPTFLPVLRAKHKATEIISESESFKDGKQGAPADAGEIKAPFTIKANDSR